SSSTTSGCRRSSWPTPRPPAGRSAPSRTRKPSTSAPSSAWTHPTSTTGPWPVERDACRQVLAVHIAEARFDAVHGSSVALTRLHRTGQRGGVRHPALAIQVAQYAADEEAAPDVALVVEIDGPLPRRAGLAQARIVLVVQSKQRVHGDDAGQ